MNKKQIINLFNLTHLEVSKIDEFIFYLKKTNNSVNLVGKSTLLNPWDRHICDCAQITSFINNKKSTILDMGTGAGFPGIILSILGYKNVTMVESKTKKTEFLKKVILKLGINAKVINSRIEKIKLPNFEYVTCRALSSLDKIIEYSLFFSKKNTTLVFLKGIGVKTEIKEAKKNFLFDYKIFDSKSDGGGFVLQITNLKRND